MSTLSRLQEISQGAPKELLYHELDEPVLTAHEQQHEYLTQKDLEKKIKEYDRLMKQAAKEYRFEDAARYRDLMRKYTAMEVHLG